MFSSATTLLYFVTLSSCAELIDIGSGVAPLEQTPVFNDVQVWRMATTKDGSLPMCQQGNLKGRFVTEMCHLVQDPYYNSNTPNANPLVVFQYCNCPQGTECSVSPRFDDPFTYATLGFLQYKTCTPQHLIPQCQKNQNGYVAKIWYGEDLPQRALLHCRCPPDHTWGQLKCTSSGRICYVLNCDKI